MASFELLHQVNFLSHTLLTLLLLPALAKADSPRITYTTSSMHYTAPFKYDDVGDGDGDGPDLPSENYGTKKLYLQIWLTELQLRMAAQPEYAHIIAHGVHPGMVYSNIWNVGIWEGHTPASTGAPPGP
ncbi:hypothetical protein N0V82_010149 [Gnomoniopsis sp. IMI 355080]|nr:hypothetical protein N0V82_010149 [Gnomoniopsis sp. IMI 355080]